MGGLYWGDGRADIRNICIWVGVIVQRASRSLALHMADMPGLIPSILYSPWALPKVIPVEPGVNSEHIWYGKKKKEKLFMYEYEIRFSRYLGPIDIDTKTLFKLCSLLCPSSPLFQVSQSSESSQGSVPSAHNQWLLLVTLFLLLSPLLLCFLSLDTRWNMFDLYVMSSEKSSEWSWMSFVTWALCPHDAHHTRCSCYWQNRPPLF